jgi:hypothetical protein
MALAQEPPAQDDLLDHARRMEKVTAQKVEADLRLALRESERLTPAKAMERLKRALAQLDDDTTLPADRRTALKRMLKDRIRVTEADAATPPGKNKKQSPAVARRADQDQQGAERVKVGKGLEGIKKLQDEGKTEQAGRQAEELAQQHPTNTPAQAAGQTAPALDSAVKARKTRKEYERRLTATYRDIDRSAAPAHGDVEFPKDWKERTKNRSTTMQLTAKEKAILKALDTPITVSFRDSRLETVKDYLETLLGQPIVLDSEALKDVEASYDSPVTMKVKGVSARIVLRKILAELGMTYVIKDETIQVTSHEKAKKMMVVRSYYIGDVLAGMGALGISPLPLTPLANQQAQATQTVQSANVLIDLIKSSVDSQSWQGNGGDGSITFSAASLSLVIKQSAEVHARLSGAGLLK